MKTVNQKEKTPEKFIVSVSNRKLFGNRLKKTVKETGLSQDAFADSIGVSRASLKNWIAGSFVPDVDSLQLISLKSKCSLNWLITGYDAEKSSLNREEMKLAIETIEEALSSTNRSVSPSRKAELVLSVYDLFISEEKVTPAQIFRLISNIA